MCNAAARRSRGRTKTLSRRLERMVGTVSWLRIFKRPAEQFKDPFELPGAIMKVIDMMKAAVGANAADMHLPLERKRLGTGGRKGFHRLHKEHEVRGTQGSPQTGM